MDGHETDETFTKYKFRYVMDMNELETWSLEVLHPFMDILSCESQVGWSKGLFCHLVQYQKIKNERILKSNSNVNQYFWIEKNYLIYHRHLQLKIQ